MTTLLVIAAILCGIWKIRKGLFKILLMIASFAIVDCIAFFILVLLL